MRKKLSAWITLEVLCSCISTNPQHSLLKTPSFPSLKRVVEDTSSSRNGYWREEAGPGVLWDNNRIVLGFASPRADPMSSPSCLEACGLLTLLAGQLLVWFKLRLENFSQGSLFPGKSVFLWLKKKRKTEKHTSLPGFYSPTSTLCHSGTDKPIANS